ncbi:16S rRNA (cytidine(1402)-2'-O)-methyltransferase [Mariluticola halotolerans]|uniref:16S rRNA (cytidine(1402)-2'-O)-methyltransferase n=1 Tax=Mariluticola halotolerans TaxID=2909283 RepID=UPI0026E12D4A|nr:16S rRNA (cytidine(1402)-2'-O)-methyltransferase [Mariluticola halotolerans]UJQ93494.1 16S rRNA (cytidine(1402)-2'-O)-methyltransferase [Mariluticola halotolerans]
MTNPKDFYLSGQALAAPALAPGLYIVATPIGNLRDITIRALETLAAADMILCEDTRQSARLLTHYGIKTHRSALHEHNERERMGNIVTRLGEGQAIALISDAGTPLLSDPGFPLVRAVREAGFEVFAVPGASALLAALTVAGLPTDRFSFIGFLPPKQGARANMLRPLANNAETLVFYESPRRLAATLEAMIKVFGPEREAAVALELTKRFERVERGTLAELHTFYTEDDTKGEAVILVSGAVPGAVDSADWEAALAKAMEDQPLRAAVDEISTLFSLKRKQVYDAALALRQTKG